MTTLYTTEALSTGAGRNGHVRTTAGRIDLDPAALKELGGSGDGANPEQLFASGYAACFHSALLGVARTKKVDVTDSSVGARVSMGRQGDGYGLEAILEVTLPGVERQVATIRPGAAHQVCPYSNATRGNIPMNLIITDD